MRCYYFGVWRAGLGHYLYLPGGCWPPRGRENGLPFAEHILDSRLLPPGSDAEANQGRVYRSVINGWTVLAFWDRSGDSRPGSNSAFVLEGEHSIGTGLALAQRQFLEIFARFPFEVRAATDA